MCSFSARHLRFRAYSLEYGCSRLQGYPNTPSERNLHKAPEQRRLPVKPTLADSERTRWGYLCRGCALQLGNPLLAHMPAPVNRLDQEVADQPDDQHAAENIHR